MTLPPTSPAAADPALETLGQLVTPDLPPGGPVAPAPTSRGGATGGLDYLSAYYFRGYLQADSGLIMQPYANLFVTCPCGDGLVARPYLALFNSTHFGDNDRMRDMSDVMLGVATTWKSLFVDARYAYYTTAPDMRAPVHEVGVKASLDALGFAEESGPISIRPSLGVYGGTIDGGADYLYVELGLEPAWRGEVAGRFVGVSLPLLWGLSGDDYYFNAAGGNAAWGYFSAGVSGSVALPSPKGCGEWFLNATFQYLYLDADNLRAINDGRRNVFLGKVGVGFVF